MFPTKLCKGISLMAAALFLSALQGAEAQKKDAQNKRVPENSNVAVVDETYNGKRIPLYVGEELVIRLRSDLKTGHRWEWLETDPHILERAHLLTPLKDAPDRRGEQSFHLRALKPGQTTVVIDYEGPKKFEAPPEKTFKLQVVVVARNSALADSLFTLRRQADRATPYLEGTNFVSPWSAGRFWGNRPPGSAYEGPGIGPGGIVISRF